MTRSNKVADPTIQIVKEVLRAAFPMHKPGIDLTCRRKDHGYNIRLVYSYKEGVEPLTRDLIHQALADRLVVSKEGERAKLTLDEVRARFAVTSVMGVGEVRLVGETATGMTQHRVSGCLRDNPDSRVVVFVDIPKHGSATAAASALHPTAFFVTAMTTNLVVPPELKGKLLTAEQAAELEPAAAKARDAAPPPRMSEQDYDRERQRIRDLYGR